MPAERQRGWTTGERIERVFVCGVPADERQIGWRRIQPTSRAREGPHPSNAIERFQRAFRHFGAIYNICSESFQQDHLCGPCPGLCRMAAVLSFVAVFMTNQMALAMSMLNSPTFRAYECPWQRPLTHGDGLTTLFFLHFRLWNFFFLAAISFSVQQ